MLTNASSRTKLLCANRREQVYTVYTESTHSTLDGALFFRAELVAERVGDYVVYCTPDRHATDAQDFREGAISLSNCIHEEYSVVDVTSKPDEKGFLLEVASAMTGLGVTIHEAIVQVFESALC